MADVNIGIELKNGVRASGSASKSYGDMFQGALSFGPPLRGALYISFYGTPEDFDAFAEAVEAMRQLVHAADGVERSAATSTSGVNVVAAK